MLYLPRSVTLEKVEHAERQFDAFIAGSLEEVATVSVGGVGQGVIRATEVTRFPHAAAREVMLTFCGKKSPNILHLYDSVFLFYCLNKLNNT